jgi:hypothetical protein
MVPERTFVECPGRPFGEGSVREAAIFHCLSPKDEFGKWSDRAEKRAGNSTGERRDHLSADIIYRFALRIPSWSWAMMNLQMFAEPSTIA